MNINQGDNHIMITNKSLNITELLYLDTPYLSTATGINYNFYLSSQNFFPELFSKTFEPRLDLIDIFEYNIKETNLQT